MQPAAQETPQQTPDAYRNEGISREHHHSHRPELPGGTRQHSPDQNCKLSEEDPEDGRTRPAGSEKPEQESGQGQRYRISGGVAVPGLVGVKQEGGKEPERE